MENVKYVVLLYKYDVVEVDLFVILHIYNKILSYKKKCHFKSFSHLKTRLLSMTLSNLRVNVWRPFVAMATNLLSCFSFHF